MKLIIDIPEWYYKETKEFVHPSFFDRAVINGIPYKEREKGEWINPEPYFNGHGIMKTCNKCGFILATHKVDKWIEDNFCPNCGADMRGKADDT